MVPSAPSRGPAWPRGRPGPAGSREQNTSDRQAHRDTGEGTLPHASLVLAQRENGQTRGTGSFLPTSFQTTRRRATPHWGSHKGKALGDGSIETNSIHTIFPPHVCPASLPHPKGEGKKKKKLEKCGLERVPAAGSSLKLQGEKEAKMVLK